MRESVNKRSRPWEPSQGSRLVTRIRVSDHPHPPPDEFVRVSGSHWKNRRGPERLHRGDRMSRIVISAHPDSSAREHSARRAIAHVFLTALVALLATTALTSAAWPVLSSDRPEGFGPSPGTDWPIGSLATGTVLPSVETDPSHHDGDTADDTAIWIHPTDPSLSLVIGDDKDGGLMVWGLDGKEVQYVDGPGYNNLDLRYNVPLAGTFSTGRSHSTVALVGVSDAGESQVDFFKVNPGT